MFLNVGKSKFMKIILFFTTFAFVGTAFVALLVYKLSGEIQGAVKVNGREIPMAEFFYQTTVIQKQLESLGVEVSRKEIYQQALRNLITQELLFQLAQKEGLEATKEEVKLYLLDIPIFQKDGKFLKELYLAYLSEMGISPSLFEEILRKELSVRHIINLHKTGFYLSQDEIDTFVNRQLAKITGRFLLIIPSQYTPTEAEIQEYYNAHKDEFASRVGKLIIVYKVDKNQLGEEKAEEKVKQVYQALKTDKPVSEGEGVEKIAETVVYDKGENLPPEVANKLDKLTMDKRILLIPYKDGYYLVKYVKDVADTPSLEKVKPQIVKALKEEYTQKQLPKLFETVKKEAKGKGIDQLAQQYSGYIKDIKGETAQTVSIEYGIPQSKVKLITRPSNEPVVIQTNRGILVAVVKDVAPPSQEEKQKMEKILKPILKENKYRTFVQMLVDKLEEESEIILNRRLFR
ncbi:MAG: hypothetical protein GXO45_06070 [Aquificae bacterium]|nr:hypothetical protein [Aquificota bacterium]